MARGHVDPAGTSKRSRYQPRIHLPRAARI